MLQTPRSLRGMVTSPHHLASEAGLRVLRDGGNAVEAAVAVAATLAVVYPHMTGIGGDGFWLIAAPGGDPVAVDGCGATAAAAKADLYQGHKAIPWRGPLAANTVAGTLSGWQAALEVASSWGKPLPLARLLEDAIHYAEQGFAVTQSQSDLTVAKLPELGGVSGFADHFLPGGKAPEAGAVMRLPALGATLRRLAERGIADFYQGELARSVAGDLTKAGSPVTLDDLARHRAQVREPLSVPLSVGRIHNFPPPTQGIASLLILALFDRLGVTEAEGFDHVHGLVEATKQAFLVRDKVAIDPAFCDLDPKDFLTEEAVAGLAARIDRRQALPWPVKPSAGDTTWMGVIDGEGRSVSLIQSIFFEYGSGVVLPDTGITWQNRGSSFSLETGAVNRLEPGRKPFHTLNPAMARFDDGRLMVYGTMGGEGQPQTQAAVFSRYALFGQPLQQAVTAPRWLLGRTWGEESVTLKLESRFDPALIQALRDAGHDVEVLEDFTGTMGHAGAIVRHPNGLLEGATDPRSDGAVAAF
ncbi:gamma-glutamyltransferase family protein [Azospirillum sp. SYSU D00513]|uniref:gamma-glutamyltransferase family protein n=1 Tax=Azospirillum sp. SYSU D00513 TaxID=2812561 RepID=UPI001A975865|nr:gamma-glutamyltransferase family protein [Azospirillum sp. SYSU D00513]